VWASSGVICGESKPALFLLPLAGEGPKAAENCSCIFSRYFRQPWRRSGEGGASVCGALHPTAALTRRTSRADLSRREGP